MKTVAHFKGKVNTFNPPPKQSLVTLTEVATGNTCDTEASSQSLLDAGINKDGDLFEIVVLQSATGDVAGKLSKIEPVGFEI